MNYILVVGEGETYMTKISRKIGMTYSYTSKIANFLLKMGIIESSRIGRIRLIKLTEKGLQIFYMLSRIANTLGIKTDEKELF